MTTQIRWIKIERRVFILEEDYVFSTTNAPPLESIPDDERIPDFRRPVDTIHARWLYNEHPNFSCIPQNIRWEGPLFGRLSQSKANLPIIQNKFGYFLDPALAKKWATLEESLYEITQVLLSKGGPGYPLDFAYFPFPRTFGYLRQHKKECQARSCAINSRDAFIPLMAMCSFGMALNGRGLEDMQMMVPHWADYLISRGVQRDWVRWLRESSVGDFSDTNPRRGAVVHVGNSQSLYFVDRLHAAGVPLWFFWGRASGLPMTPKVLLSSMIALKPNQADVTKALENFRFRKTIDEGREKLESLAPAPYPNSRQLQGESVQSYFDRLEAKLKKMEENESEERRARRMKRLEVANTFKMPSKHGARVFYWESVDGYRLRKPVDRADVWYQWGEYTRSQKKYDSLHHEWDIGSVFSPDDAPSDDSDDDGYSDHNDYNGRNSPRMFDQAESPPRIPSPLPGPSSLPAQPNPSLLPEPSSLPAQPTIPSNDPDYPLSLATFNRDVLSSVNHDDTSSYDEYEVDGLDDILYYRFGLNFSEFPYEEVALPPGKSLEWKEVRRLLSDQASLEVENRMRKPVTDFVRCLLASKDGVTGFPVPGKFWDISSTNPLPLAAEPNRQFNLRRYRLDDGPVYLLHLSKPSRHDTTWRLAVRDAASVLEIFRRSWGPYSDSVAARLLCRGIPFQTLALRSPNTPSAPPPPICHGLGYRQVGYQASVADYAAYEIERSRLLSSPNGRAALLKGGIIWRLAKEHLSDDLALMGPSSDARNHAVFSFGDYTYYDDSLSDDELALISGVYKVFAGSGLQHSETSWWPKHSAWLLSGLNVGYWSQDCETWYQNRVSQIKAGTAVPRTATQWRKALDLTKNAPKLAKANSLAAEKHIAGILIP